LKTGSRGPLVEDLQRALNDKLRPSPNLVPDGIFGSATDRAVKKFQADHWLTQDGDVGPCTHNALYGHEAYAPVLHRIPFIPQPTSTTCWAASTAMMTNSNVAAVKARTPQSMWTEASGLWNSSDSDQAIVTGTAYGRVHNLRCNAPQSYMLSALRGKLQRGPLMFDMLWHSNEYAQGSGSPGHMICVVGIRGDGDQTGKGTTLRLHDPWPPGRGKVSSVNAGRWLAEVPTRTYRVFEK
jgi:peptidoglycan hydrolase-like protein with peptidoglycan-binding domain